jgi:hypothetical protein
LLLLLLPAASATAQQVTSGDAGGAGGEGGQRPDSPPPPAKQKRVRTHPLSSRLSTEFELKPTDTVRGARVTVRGDDLPSDLENATLWLDDIDIGPPSSVDESGTSFSFVIPDSGQIGEKPSPIKARRYVLRLSEPIAPDTGKPPASVTLGVLRVVGEKLPPFRLDGVYPTIVYPDTRSLILTGSGFGGRLRDYSLMIDGVEVGLCPEGTPQCADTLVEGQDDCCKGPSARFVSDHQLEIRGAIDDKNQKAEWPFKGPRGGKLTGEHHVGIRSGDETAAKPVKVAFSSWTIFAVQATALAFTLLLFIGIVALVVTGGGTHKVGARVHRAFLLDTETDTYSLAKLQAFAWGATVLLAYAYLVLSRTLVQGRLDIVDVPQNLIHILTISLGTTVASLGISKFRGPKAAGGLQPSFGDLVSVGGVVSPERVFLLCWTGIAIGTFLLNVFMVDPMILGDLPVVPDGLLALSGVSAGGYLGGKLARGPGPVIDEVMLRQLPPLPVVPPVPAGAPAPAPPLAPAPAKWEVLVTGRYLGIDASFEVDGKPITRLLASSHEDRRAHVLTLEHRDDERFAKSLTLRLTELPPAWQNPSPNTKQTLTIANSDGQRATAEVTRDA